METLRSIWAEPGASFVWGLAWVVTAPIMGVEWIAMQIGDVLGLTDKRDW